MHQAIRTEDETRTKLLASIAEINAEAKAISRQGAGPMLTPEYAAYHQRLNALVAELTANGDE